jgi:hypothetical protein
LLMIHFSRKFRWIGSGSSNERSNFGICGLLNHRFHPYHGHW